MFEGTVVASRASADKETGVIKGHNLKVVVPVINGTDVIDVYSKQAVKPGERVKLGLSVFKGEVSVRVMPA